jgi:ESCRT-I complex subunit TSG101
MSAVSDKVLNWLYSVLTSVSYSHGLVTRLPNISQEYHDVGRTYADVAEALSHFPSLAPRTEVYSMPSSVLPAQRDKI